MSVCIFIGWRDLRQSNDSENKGALLYLTSISVILNKKKMVFLINGDGKSGYSHIQKYLYLTLLAKINSKWTKGINKRPETIKFQVGIGEEKSSLI